MVGTTSTRDPRQVMGRRVGAYLIDALIGFTITVVLFFTLADRVDALDLVASLTADEFDQVLDEVDEDDDVCAILEAVDDDVSFCFSSDETLFHLDGGQTALVFLIPVGYWLLLNGIIQGLTGATIGKAMLGLRAVDEQGNICGIPKALGRTIVGIVDSLPTLMGVGFLVAVNRDDRRRLGDMAAKTNVVRTADVGRPPDRAVTTTTWAPPPPGQGTPPPTSGTYTAPAPPGPGDALTPPPSPPDAAGAPPAIPPGAEEGPVWDANRQKYVQIQPGSGILLVFDDDTQAWRPADDV